MTFLSQQRQWYHNSPDVSSKLARPTLGSLTSMAELLASTNLARVAGFLPIM
ncbi:hypothetical protein FD28_GL000026 [Levilactobacillus hammesii DSM 16381]|uniref:Uncharacterized protein n=2 Tax=Levilactobacillus hammesii TaxID=267633 RepID=A0A0R1UZK6_9LACO|nr:hypothetical protein FD28_GL000026 [Levilactobacillus hammesii DSM 16381]